MNIAGILVGIAAVLAIGSGIYSLLMWVPAYTGILLENTLTGSVRSCGPGLNLIWPWEKTVADSETSLQIRNYLFEDDFETEEEIAASLKVSIDLIPDAKRLIEYRRYDAGNRLDGIIGKIKSILNVEVRRFKNLDETMNSLEKLAETVKQRFGEQSPDTRKSPEEYYGVKLERLMISGVGLPPSLKEAAVKKEVTLKENEIRGLEMKKLEQMAAALVKRSEATTGMKMPFERAMEFVQLQFGKGNVTRSTQIFGIDAGTQEVLKKLLEEIAKGVFHGKS